METMKDRARAVVNSVGFREDPEAAIAAALQQVADECADIAFSVALLYKNSNPKARERVRGNVDRCKGADSVSNEIRSRFPRCPDGE